MRVIHINNSDNYGGAARVAFRIHHCLSNAGVDSRMWVNYAATCDWTVEGPVSVLQKAMIYIRPHLVSPLRNALRTHNQNMHSPAVLPSRWVRRINESDADIVHLHWVQDEMLSIADIGRIKKPIVWTLHDMWAFCGAEHYTDEFRWREGYHQNNRPQYESGLDLNRWVWKRKCKHWKKPMHIVTSSRWLAGCAQESALMRDWPVSVIQNPIETEQWSPIEQSLARELLGLPKDVPLLLFGAMGGTKDPRKGFDLLLASLEQLRNKAQIRELELVVFGQCAPKNIPDLGFPVHYTGHLHDVLSLRALYSAADAFVLPSRLDNLPSTGIESLACGTAVIAFNIGGIPDMIKHKQNGYIARAFDTLDLSNGIKWVLTKRKISHINNSVRESSVDKFAYATVASAYKEVYSNALTSV